MLQMFQISLFCVTRNIISWIYGSPLLSDYDTHKEYKYQLENVFIFAKGRFILLQPPTFRHNIHRYNFFLSIYKIKNYGVWHHSHK